MNNLNVDLNLLKIAASLLRHQNVSKSAQELGLSQSAVSHALARLRVHFKDPMFVRTSRGVVPTDFAKKIAPEVLELMERISGLAARKASFDPKTARGRITLSTTDYFEISVLSLLQPMIAKEAPHLQILIRPTLGELPVRDLETGHVDYAIAGFYKEMPEGFYRTKLFADRFKCVVRKDHPRLSTRQAAHVSLEQFYQEKHALISIKGDFKVRDNPNLPHKRQISYSTYSFTSLPWLLQTTDMILTAPGRLVEKFSEFFPMRVFDPPLDLGKIDIQMIWHLRVQQDPLHRWFREKLSALLLSKTKQAL